MDQGLTSASALVLSVLLTRWANVAVYGVFAVVFAVTLLFAGVLNAVAIEPMSVLGSNRFAEERPQYLVAITVITCCLGGFGGLALVACGLVPAFGAASGPYGALVASGLALPFMFVATLFRRASYVFGRPRWAAEGAAAYALGAVVSLTLMHDAGPPTAATGFIALGIGSVLQLLWIAIRARSVLRSGRVAGLRSGVREVLRENWSYGRWVIAQSFVSWVSSAAYTPIAAASLGLSAAGSFRIMQLLFQPFQLGLTAYEQMALPRLSRRAVGDPHALGSARRWTWMVVLMTGSAYLGAILLAAPILGERVLGLPELRSMLLPIAVLGLASIVSGVLQAEYIHAKAARRPYVVFWALSASAAFTVLFGVAVIREYGLVGGAVAVGLSQAMALVVAVMFNGVGRGPERNMRDPRVCFLIPTLQRAPYFPPVLSALGSSGFSVVLVTADLPEGTGTRAFDLVRVPPPRSFGTSSSRTTPLMVFPSFAGVRALGEIRPNVVFTSGFNLWSMACVLLKGSMGFKVVMLYDGSSPSADDSGNRLRSIQRRLVASGLDMVVSNTLAGVRYLEGVLPSDCELVQGYYLVPGADSREIRQSAPAGALRIMFAGRIQDGKGIREMLDVCCELDERGVSWRLDLIGDGSLSDWVVAEASRRGLRGAVEVSGWLPHEDVVLRLHESDVFLYLSREDVWAVAVVEALQAGVPVVVADTVGAAELVVPGFNGYVVDSDGAGAADVLAGLWRDSGRSVEMSMNARESVATLSPESAARLFASCVEKLTKHRSCELHDA